MTKKAIIFDLDGTLWDVTESTYISANKIASKYNVKGITKETICKGFGMNKEESAKLYFPDLELEESLKYIFEIGSDNIAYLQANGGKLFENEIETIEKLYKEFDLYIVSNTSRNEYIEAFLNHNEMKKYFKDYIAASLFGSSKSEAIKKIIKDNNIENAIYIGDTIKDKEAASQAGIKFVHAKYGFGEDLQSDYSINEIGELATLLLKE